MVLSPVSRRRIFNRFGVCCTLFNFLLLISSLVFWLVGEKHWWASIVAAVISNYLLTLALSVSLINADKRSDLFLINYLFIFWLLPFIGIFLYFAFGFYSIHLDNTDEYADLYYRYKKYEFKKINRETIKEKIKGSSYRAFAYNKIKHNAITYRNVDISILGTAIETLREITHLINSAKRFIHMEFYLFCDGLILEHMLSLLSKKVQEGVEVRVIADYVGNLKRLKKSTIKRLRKAGIQVRIFNPPFKKDTLWWQLRNHNKVIIVDNEYALFGSCNIADEYFNITSKFFQTTELTTKLTGPIVNSFTSLFLSHWDLCNTKKKRAIHEFSEKECLKYFYSEKEEVDHSKETIAQVLDNSPISNEMIIKDNLMQLIFSAHKRIIISTPYFFPPEELITALKQASISGVSVKILVPKNPDLINFFSTLNRQLFSKLLDNKIEIYEYFGFNHEKLMIIDDDITYFGTYNWDYRALYLNFESAMLIKCKSVVESMDKFMEQQFKNSHRIYRSDLRTPKNFISASFTTFIRIFKPFL